MKGKKEKKPVLPAGVHTFFTHRPSSWSHRLASLLPFLYGFASCLQPQLVPYVPICAQYAMPREIRCVCCTKKARTNQASTLKLLQARVPNVFLEGVKAPTREAPESQYSIGASNKASVRERRELT